MIVLSIKFNPTSSKSYDYLLVNPKNLKIDEAKPLRSIVSCGKDGAFYKSLTIVNKTETKTLPSWVTSKIVIDGNNICRTEKISVKTKTISKKPLVKGTYTDNPIPIVPHQNTVLDILVHQKTIEKEELAKSVATAISKVYRYRKGN